MQKIVIIFGLLVFGMLLFGCAALTSVLVKPTPIETCQVQTPFECVSGSYSLNKNNDVLTLSLHNVGYETIKITNISCGFDGLNYINSKSINEEVSVGNTTTLEFDCKGQTDPSAKIGQDGFQGSLYFIYAPISYPNMTKVSSIRIAVKYS